MCVPVSVSSVLTGLMGIGNLTGGGDAPGLNAAIRAVVKAAANQRIETIGLRTVFAASSNRIDGGA